MMKTMNTAQEPIPLWRQLQATAAVIGAVRNGSSGTAVVEAVAAPLPSPARGHTRTPETNVGAPRSTCHHAQPAFCA